MIQMKYPAFFDNAPRLVVYDPLSDFLGSSESGILEYRSLDVVKLAGHSCPTVAGAYLMTRKALAHLYGAGLPVRGDIRHSAAKTTDNKRSPCSHYVSEGGEVVAPGFGKGDFSGRVGLGATTSIGGQRMCWYSRP